MEIEKFGLFLISASQYVFIWRLTWVLYLGSSFIQYCKVLRYAVMNVINYSGDGRQPAAISLLLCSPAWRKQHLPLPWTIPTSSSQLGSKWAVELLAEVTPTNEEWECPLEKLLSPQCGHLASTLHEEATDRSINQMLIASLQEKVSLYEPLKNND